MAIRKQAMRQTQDGRTYHLDTVSGAVGAYLQTLLIAGGLGWSLYEILKGEITIFKWLVLSGCGLLMMLFVLPMWWNWVRRMKAETVRQDHEAKATSPRIVGLKLEIDYEEAKRHTIDAINRLDKDQLEVVKDMGLAPAIEIHTGARVVWKLDGLSVPVWFALDWWREYQKRDDDTLPGQSAFAGYENRDQYRTWVQALTAELVRMGVVRAAGGPYPPRWVVSDERARIEVLKRSGIFLALTAAGWEEEEEEE